MPVNQSLLFKIATGVLGFLSLILLGMSYTEVKVSLKDGAFESVLQDRLPVRANIHGVAYVNIDRVWVLPDSPLSVKLEGEISDRRAKAPYSLELGYNIEIVGKGVHFVPFVRDQKTDGHEFTVAQELLPNLFEVLSTKPIYTIKRSGLIGLRVSEALPHGEDFKIVIAGFEMVELVIGFMLAIAALVAWRYAKKALAKELADS